MPKGTPFRSHKEALGALLDLIQYRSVLNGFKLTEEERAVFVEAVRFHDRNE